MKNLRQKNVLIVVLVVVNIATGCENKMSMSWSIENMFFKLTCKIKSLQFQVLIIDPQGNEKAHCISPFPKMYCYSFSPYANVTQYSETNETVLRLPSNSYQGLNGKWTCLHGRNKDSAYTDVFIENCVGKDKSGTSCWITLICWTMLSFFSFFILSRILIWIIECFKDETEKKISTFTFKICEKFSKLCRCFDYRKSKSVRACRRILFIIVIVYVVSLPVLVGFAELTVCSGFVIFATIGSVFGVISNLLLYENEAIVTLDDQGRHGDLLSNVQDESQV